MGRRQHFLTPYVVVLHAAKKANKSNKYAVCRACISIIGKDEAYRLKFANTKKECARHIKNCQSFAQKYSSQQIAKLLDDATKDDNLEETLPNLEEITLDNYIFRPLTFTQKQKLEQLLLDNLATKIEEQDSDDLYDFPEEHLNYQNAKWRLRDIFIESLGEPNYLPNFML
ncbi:20175_t:CDS:2, partial [Funneliformis geosporum]